MHKYILKTPKFVIKNIRYVKQINNNLYWIRWNEKIFSIRYELNKMENSSFYETTNIILLSKWFISDIVDDYEFNIFNFYSNNKNGIINIEQVIFYKHMEELIEITNYLIDYIDKNNLDKNNLDKNNLDNTHDKINLNLFNVIKYNYEDWTYKYFGGNINNYIKS
jgi:hypothetical protein